jgi:biotin-dependent carboxylase-like uncharacterized protein
MIHVLAAGALTTVQDLGRHGCLRWGVGTAGAMDPLALAAGNLLLGNDENAAAVEVPVFPFRVRFAEELAFAVTGADCAAGLDGVPLLPWSAQVARAGQTLELGLPQRGAWHASRAYLCVAGGVDVPEVLHSRSTQLRGAFGGVDGRPLRVGDVLRAGASRPSPPTPGVSLIPPALALPLEVNGCPAVRVLPAAEYNGYTAASHEAFWSAEWKISAQSDRYGYRFAGPVLEPRAAMELRSHGIVPGVIQVPAGGQPIVQMRDAQPSGGYPKIGTVIEADLWRLGQAPIGTRVRFLRTGWDEALAALDERRGWLAETRRLLELLPSASRSA